MQPSRLSFVRRADGRRHLGRPAGCRPGKRGRGEREPRNERQPRERSAAAAGTQPARFHRLKVGDVEVTTLPDGAMQGTNENIQRFFPDSRPEDIAPLRERAFAIEAGLHQPVGAHLLNTGRNLALADRGGHSSFIPKTGRRSPRCAPRAARPSRWTRCG